MPSLLITSRAPRTLPGGFVCFHHHCGPSVARSHALSFSSLLWIWWAFLSRSDIAHVFSILALLEKVWWKWDGGDGGEGGAERRTWCLVEAFNVQNKGYTGNMDTDRQCLIIPPPLAGYSCGTAFKRIACSPETPDSQTGQMKVGAQIVRDSQDSVIGIKLWPGHWQKYTEQEKLWGSASRETWYFTGFYSCALCALDDCWEVALKNILLSFETGWDKRKCLRSCRRNWTVFMSTLSKLFDFEPDSSTGKFFFLVLWQMLICL